MLTKCEAVLTYVMLTKCEAVSLMLTKCEAVSLMLTKCEAVLTYYVNKIWCEVTLLFSIFKLKEINYHIINVTSSI